MHPSVIARSEPDKPAVIMAASGESVSFGELDARSNRAAQLFRKLGLAVGDGLCIFMENNIRFHEICWAAQRAGLYFTAVS
ncbi:MAG TPA: AMP-binding protein, partial [Rhizomicrobium sp.]